MSIGSLQGYAIQNSGLLELVGANVTIAQNEWCASQAVEIPDGPGSGEILGASLIQRETGTGAILKVDGELHFFDADPGLSAGDAALTAAAAQAALGAIAVASADWTPPVTVAGFVTKQCAIPFSRRHNLWVAFLLTSATSINSVAGDDEILELRFHWRRDT